MRKLLLFFAISFLCTISSNAQEPFDKKMVLKQNDARQRLFYAKMAEDVGKTIVTNKERPSNIWTRGVYYEGLMALHEISPKRSLLRLCLFLGRIPQVGIPKRKC